MSFCGQCAGICTSYYQRDVLDRLLSKNVNKPHLPKSHDAFTSSCANLVEAGFGKRKAWPHSTFCIAVAMFSYGLKNQRTSANSSVTSFTIVCFGVSFVFAEKLNENFRVCGHHERVFCTAR